MVSPYFGPNNQLIHHIDGMLLAQHCGVLYYNAPVKSHWSDRASKVWQLGDIIDSAPGLLSPFFRTELAYYVAGVAPGNDRNFRHHVQPFVRTGALWSALPLNTAAPSVCSTIKAHPYTFIHITFGHRYKFLPSKSSFTLNHTLQAVANNILSSEPALYKGFHCLLIRQRDDQFYNLTDPFANLPLCSTFSDSIACITGLAQRLRALRGHLPVLLVTRSPPMKWAGQLRKAHVYLLPHNSSVFVDMAICNHSPVIAYTDNMTAQVGLGGGASTVYQVLSRLRRDSTRDVPFSQMLL